MRSYHYFLIASLSCLTLGTDLLANFTLDWNDSIIYQKGDLLYPIRTEQSDDFGIFTLDLDETDQDISSVLEVVASFNPEVICITGLLDSDMIYDLYRKLGNEYAHFYQSGTESRGIFVASQYKLENFDLDEDSLSSDNISKFAITQEDNILGWVIFKGKCMSFTLDEMKLFEGYTTRTQMIPLNLSNEVESSTIAFFTKFEGSQEEKEGDFATWQWNEFSQTFAKGKGTGSGRIKVTMDSEGNTSVRGEIEYSRESSNGESLSAEMGGEIKRNNQGNVDSSTYFDMKKVIIIDKK